MKQTTNSPELPLRIGITGGIGSGKSYVCHQLEQAGHRIFYCDDEAKRIIRTHPDVMDELRALVGPQVYDADGGLNKPVLAAYLCQGRHYSQQVDRIVHPRVAQAFGQFCAAQPSATNANLPIPPGKCLSLEALQQLPASGVVFMECALLFESGFNRLVDYSVLVHVCAQTQLQRLMARDHITAQKAQSWIDLQLSESEKMARADAYIVNE